MIAVCPKCGKGDMLEMEFEWTEYGGARAEFVIVNGHVEMGEHEYIESYRSGDTPWPTGRVYCVNCHSSDSYSMNELIPASYVNEEGEIEEPNTQEERLF